MFGWADHLINILKLFCWVRKLIFLYSVFCPWLLKVFIHSKIFPLLVTIGLSCFLLKATEICLKKQEEYPPVHSSEERITSWFHAYFCAKIFWHIIHCYWQLFLHQSIVCSLSSKLDFLNSFLLMLLNFPSGIFKFPYSRHLSFNLIQHPSNCVMTK